MIVLDASVLIAYLDGANSHHDRARELLAREIDDDFGANTLTLAEVLVLPAGENRLDLVEAILRDLEVRELPFPEDTAVALAQLRATTGLKLPDCCVLLAAETVGGRMASFDAQLNRVAAARNLVTVVR